MIGRQCVSRDAGLCVFHLCDDVMCRYAGVYLDSTTDFTVDATSVQPAPAEGLVRALITSPTGSLTEAIVKNQQNGLYQCLYTPTEQGHHPPGLFSSAADL